MRGIRRWSRILILVLVTVMMTGCEANIPADSKAMETGRGNEETVWPEFPINENTGVITDTLGDVFLKPEITAQKITQVMFNQPILIEEEADHWTRITLDEGQTGWVQSKYVSRDTTSIDSRKHQYKVIVSGKESKVMSQPKGGLILTKAVMGTVFYSKGKMGNMYELAMPGNVTGWLDEKGTIQVSVGMDIPETSAADFVATALKYKGVSYITGGISAYGLDCAGLIYTCSRINGMEMPRDLQAQYASNIGKSVDVIAIEAGDLLFFKAGNESQDITMAGIYLGMDEFLYADRSKGLVKTGLLTEEYYAKRLMDVKRIFKKVG